MKGLGAAGDMREQEPRIGAPSAASKKPETAHARRSLSCEAVSLA